MADFMKALQQMQEVQGKLQKMQEELRARTVSGTAGGGMVTVEADGTGAVKRVKIDPSIVNPADVEMLEDLMAVAIAEAQKKASELSQSMAQEEMSKAMPFPLPFKLPF